MTKILLVILAVLTLGRAFGAEAPSVFPKILFHGGGGGAPKSITNMSSAATQLERLGYPKEHILKVRYPDRKNISEITAAVEPQLKKFIARYPSDTQFDVLGHSLGHVVSFVTMAKLGLLDKIRKLIGLAGVMFGQLGEKPGLCRFEILAPYYCGDIFDLLVGTTEPPFILDLMEKNAEEMKRIEKCSLFSPEDGMLDPYDSGAFADGTNISIPNMHHLKFKSSPLVFEKMKEECFRGEL
jgi:hypothetical protein